MTTTRACAWTSNSGNRYDHEVYPIGGSLPHAPGNYILSKKTPTGWVALYIGQTNDLRQRISLLAQHGGHPCAIRSGMTHVHVYVNHGGRQSRLEIERELITRYRPICNRGTGD